MKRDRIMPKDMTPPMGAYSHGYAVELGAARLIFVTGQIPVDHKGELVSNDVGEQTRFVFNRIKGILEEAGSSMRDVVKAQVFLTDIDDFGTFTPIRDEFFAEAHPASTLVEVSSLVREGCKVEVEVIAIANNE